MQKIIKKYRVYGIVKIDILGITEVGLGEGDILYKTLTRDKKVEIRAIDIRKENDKTMFKIRKPEDKEIKSSTDFWLFSEDTED